MLPRFTEKAILGAIERREIVSMSFSIHAVKIEIDDAYEIEISEDGNDEFSMVSLTGIPIFALIHFVKAGHIDSFVVLNAGAYNGEFLRATVYFKSGKYWSGRVTTEPLDYDLGQIWDELEKSPRG